MLLSYCVLCMLFLGAGLPAGGGWGVPFSGLYCFPRVGSLSGTLR